MNLPVTLHGKVQSGNRIGRTFDMPTANITPKEDLSGLTFGVYYSVITLDGKEYPSITNLGVRPTVSDDGRVNAETFIYDYDDDIYDKDVAVTLLSFRRSEQRFNSLDELFFTVKDDFRAGAKFHNLVPSAEMTSPSMTTSSRNEL
ncbi:MAG: riboflavin kinase [Lachnospiraceae bacterium]|nr:riboflavin kinase [Lachnospiraceae bacterium]